MHRLREDGGNNRIGGMPTLVEIHAAASVREEAECSRFDVPGAARSGPSRTW